MKYFLSISCALLLSCVAMAQTELPGPLQHLKGLADNEAELVKAARLFHRQQIELNEWDFKEAILYSGKDRAKVQTMIGERMETRKEHVRIAWEYVLKRYPKNALAMNYMGEYWYDMGQNIQAGLKYWKEALMLDNELAVAYNNMGLHYTHMGEPKRGLAAYLKALELEPNNPDFLFNMAQFYMTQFPFIAKETKIDYEQVYRKGMEFSLKAAKNAPGEYDFQMDYATNFYAAQNFGVVADWPLAAKAWQETYPLAPGKIERFQTRLNEGRCWLFAKRKTEALTALQAAKQLNPHSEAVDKLIVRANEMEGLDLSPKTVRVRSSISVPEGANAE